MSGLVPLSTMMDDFYVFDPQRNYLVGRRTRRVIRLGDKVEVQVAKVDTFKKQVDFRLAAGANRSRQQQQPPQPRHVPRRGMAGGRRGGSQGRSRSRY
jgi:ribonuclease R